MQKIGVNNGIETSRKVEDALHPTYPAGFGSKTGTKLPAWDMRASTLQLLVGNTNELIDVEARQDGQITQLWEAVTALQNAPAIPFPASGQLKAGGT